MEISVGGGVCLVVIGVLWRGALDESAAAWLRATRTVVNVIGVAAIAVTMAVNAIVGPIETRALATLLIVAGITGVLFTWG